MIRFQAAVGIDPSGGSLRVVAVRGGIGGPSLAFPPLSHDFRADRDDARFAEAEGVLGDFVARNGLVGARAFLVLPADRVHLARAVFPPMREKDLREAVGLELERLFPLAPSTLRHGYRRLPDAARDGKVRLVVAAAPLDLIERWEETVSRVGLALAAAVPAPWAVAAALSRLGVLQPAEAGALSAVLRWGEGRVEGTVLSGGEAVFSGSRPAPPESAPSEGLSLALSGLTDVPVAAEEAGVDLYAPAGWFPPGEFRPGSAGFSFRVKEGLPQAVAALSVAGGAEGPADPLPFLCSWGAAAGGEGMDLLAPHRAGEASRMAAGGRRGLRGRRHPPRRRVAGGRRVEGEIRPPAARRADRRPAPLCRSVRGDRHRPGRRTGEGGGPARGDVLVRRDAPDPEGVDGPGAQRVLDPVVARRGAEGRAGGPFPLRRRDLPRPDARRPLPGRGVRRPDHAAGGQHRAVQDPRGVRPSARRSPGTGGAR